MSLPQHVWQVTSPNNRSDGVLHIEYFGTYLSYLPTNLISSHCDTFQLITDQSQLDLRYSTTPYVAELVCFFLETLRISLASQLLLFDMIEHHF